MKKYIITTPIYYPNDEIHIGGLFTTIIADIHVRILRLFNHDVYFLTGLDEHGYKIQKRSSELNLQPKNYVDIMADKYIDIFNQYNISYSRFIRTTDTDHIENVLKNWKLAEPYIYKDKYIGYYCIRDETFYSESELINGLTPTGNLPERIEEECYFFNLQAFYTKITEMLKNSSYFCQDWVQNQLLSYIKNGLKPLCISRPESRLKWGIKLPDNNIIYVWFDALFNYLTPKKWNDDIVIHYIGKDITIFHGVYWPIFLLATGNRIFDKLFTHCWWVFNGDKMSKSKGNVITAKTLIDQYNPDVIRFYFLYTGPLTRDTEFSEEDMITLFNNIVVNKFSNLIHRVFSLVKQHNIIITPYTDNIFIEKLYSSIVNNNLRLYLNLLIEQCDYYNELVEKLELWKNPQHINQVANPLIELIKYWSPILTTIQFDIQDPKPIFHRI